ncbi:alpha/beta hydrolase [Actinoplanes sp. NBRC 101535]|uniref:dienelactone hydrolase family protein n=1 Tax=Actinoplanes sp. NBRC 101535 TaxID=3032196 RepID=UPI0024A1189E|nr:alpha/beta hydrolase [Actinoplanes sp. NBRC 101535]GLY03761.1 hypothetical protein Acsp01_41400 [Actinoplanes sp. NBRC 101535]
MRRTLLLLLVLAATGAWLIAGADQGLRREHVVATGVPLDVVHPSGDGRRPGVVVAHGYSGSARMMAPFGDSLAARGYVVVMLDFTGHGANTRPMAPGTTDMLQPDLDAAVAHLRSLPDVDPSKIALVGHSMGGGAVTRYAAGHPDITATVAISMPDATVATAEQPARLLTMAGALEFPSFRAVATSVAGARADREARIVSGVEHITILFAPETHRETAAWLDNAFGGAPDNGAIPFPGRRLTGAMLLVLAFFIGLHPLASLLGGTPGTPWPRLPSLAATVRVVVVTTTAAVPSAVIARFLPTNHLPLAIAGYVAGFAAVCGTLLFAYARKRSRGTRRNRPQLLVVLPYAILAAGAPVHFGLTHAWPVGPRWWLLPIVWAGFALLAYGAELSADDNPLLLLPIAAVVVVVLVAAAAVNLTSGFVALIVAPMIALLIWQALWSVVLRRFATPTWLIALTGSAVVAWPLAVALPLTT